MRIWGIAIGDDCLMSERRYGIDEAAQVVWIDIADVAYAECVGL